MRELGGDVTERIYPGVGHTIVADEVEQIRRIVGHDRWRQRREC